MSTLKILILFSPHQRRPISGPTDRFMILIIKTAVPLKQANDLNALKADLKRVYPTHGDSTRPI